MNMQYWAFLPESAKYREEWMQIGLIRFNYLHPLHTLCSDYFFVSLFSTFEQVCWSYCVTDWGTEIRPKSDSKKSFLVRCLRYEFLSSCHVTLLNKVSHPQLLRCGTARSERPPHRLWPIKQRPPSCFICRVFISLYSSYMLTFSLNFISCSHSCA